MDELDLDIDNYDLTELWALFNLENGFTKTDLKSAYRIVLKTHPDKSGLPKEYFLFFSRAFKMIKKIFYMGWRTFKLLVNLSINFISYNS